MGQRSVRFPDELEQAILAEAEALDRPFSWVVVNAVRAELAEALDRPFSWVVVNAVRAELARGRRGSPLVERALESALGAPATPEGTDVRAVKAPAPTRTSAPRESDAMKRQRAMNKAKGL